MAKLWKKLPPPMADNFGLIEVINKTDGMGILDDCSEYRTSAERSRRRRGTPQMRVVHTEIRSEDAVTGTRAKVLDTFWEYREEFSPEFVLLSAGPCSAMIGTDLEEIAQEIETKSGIRAAAVGLSGHKAYDAGISETLLSLVRLLTEPGEVRRNSINLLGATTLDWQEENAAALRGWLEEKGFSVIANLGGAEKAENIAKAGEAAANLVVTVSGLAAARYLEKEYGTPYLAMAPFGKTQAENIITALREKMQLPTKGRSGAKPQSESPGPKILIIGEQLLANAVRETLRCDFHIENVRVGTFFTLEKTLAEPEDKKIRDEKEAAALLGGDFDIILADPLLRCFAPEGCLWMDLPQKAFELYGEHPPLPLFLGENLNQWLERAGIGRR